MLEILTAAATMIALALFHRCRRLERGVRRAELESAGAERRRIAGDIHDDLGQNLLTLKLELARLERLPDLPAAAVLQLGAMQDHMDHTVRSLRAVINGLTPVALEHGLRCAIERQVVEFSRASGIHCELEAARYRNEGDSSADATLLRVLQESLANIARHARASEVRIALARHDGLLSMTISDNGAGIAEHAHRQGQGLQGIERRVAQAGGSFALSSASGHGTALAISLPVARPAHAANQPQFTRQRTTPTSH